MSTKVGNLLGVSEELRREMLPSGTQSTLQNRVNWAMYYLYRAGLLNRPSKGKYFISDEGLKTLGTDIEKIDNTFLEQFESFKKFKNKTNTKSSERTQKEESANTVDPVERIEQTSSLLKNELATATSGHA